MSDVIANPGTDGRGPAPSGSAADLEGARVRLAAFMIGAGIMHFLAPGFYRRIVPRWAGDARLVVIWSGLAELLSGVLLAVPRTRRLGAWLALTTLVVVYPANVQMALDAGRPKDLESAAVWARLPLQLPMWRAAWRQTR